jgi:carbonic anhydrase/acetyltransferase-like protein (isoleucine patch superfamily)
MHQFSLLSYNGIRPRIDSTAYIAAGVRIIGDVEIHKDVSIWFNAVLRGDVQRICIGEGSNIQDLSMVHVTTNGNPTLVGKFVTVGHSVILHACTIEDYSLIGMGSTILDGAVIPRYSLVAAGSVISPNKTFPEKSLIIGSPAKAKRLLTEKELAYLDYSATHYMSVMKQYQREGG